MLERYLAQDRRRALAEGRELPERIEGAALFADLAGFTALGRRMTKKFGAQRGAEEFVRAVNAVYDALVECVEGYGGSVIGFAGDGLCCWFDDANGDAAGLSLACGQAMQQAMLAFDGLLLKVCITRGPARRFVVGDPAIQRMDVVAGETIARLEAAQQMVRQGEVVVDAALAEALRLPAAVLEPRQAVDGARFSRVARCDLTTFADVHVAVRSNASTLDASQVRPWILPAVYERECSGHRSLLAELRETVVLFIRFGGIDYDRDPDAGGRLDEVTRTVQVALERNGGTLLQLTLGDKGSYCYAAFGALVAHEDDSVRAARTASQILGELSVLPYLDAPQLGLSAGVSMTGAYGARTRATYGVLGDSANLAARLMMLARPGEVLIDDTLRDAVAREFVLRHVGPILVKGRAEPVVVYALGPGRDAPRPVPAVDDEPLVGRSRELDFLARRLDVARGGHVRVVAIAGEAGIGKTRLAVEAAKLAQDGGFRVLREVCEATGQHTPYLAWRSVWRELLCVSGEIHRPAVEDRLRQRVSELAPQRLSGLPTLAPLLGVPLQENDFTAGLTPQDRHNVLCALLEDCLRSVVREKPLLVVLEDMHWADPLSLQLLEGLVREGEGMAWAVVLTYRHTAGPTDPALARLPACSTLTLDRLPRSAVDALVHRRLSAWYPTIGTRLARILARKLDAQAQGNPFYLEELLSHLHAGGLMPRRSQEVERIALELPSSLRALILSRIDRLTESQRATLKVASVIGQRFPVHWLHGFYPALGTLDDVKANLAELERLGFTPQDAPEPEPSYEFKHVLMREVTYETLPYAIRTQLHGQLAEFLETRVEAPSVDLLAHHYGMSDRIDKRREYLRRAAVAAEETGATQSALAYWEQLLPLAVDSERIDIELACGRLLTDLGRWAEADARFRAALGQAEALGHVARQAAIAHDVGALLGLRGDFAGADAWLTRALSAWHSLGVRQEEGRTYASLAHNSILQQAFQKARTSAERAIEVSRECGDAGNVAMSLALLGHAWHGIGDNARARSLLDEALNLSRQLDDRSILDMVLGLRVRLATEMDDLAFVLSCYEESLALARRSGDQHGVVAILIGMGIAQCRNGHYARARPLFEDAVRGAREAGDKPQLAHAHFNLGLTMRELGDMKAARSSFEKSLALFKALENPALESRTRGLLGYLALHEGDLSRAEAFLQAALALAREHATPALVAEILDHLGLVALRRGLPVQARRRLREALGIRSDGSDPDAVILSLVSWAALATCLRGAEAGAMLAAAAEALCAASDLALDDFNRRLLSDTIACAQAGADAATFEAARARGSAMTLDDAVAFAWAIDGSEEGQEPALSPSPVAALPKAL